MPFLAPLLVTAGVCAAVGITTHWPPVTATSALLVTCIFLLSVVCNLLADIRDRLPKPETAPATATTTTN